MSTEEFLRKMIAHHEGAIHMSQEYLDAGGAGNAATLARKIIRAQRPEIESMRKMQRREEM